MKNSLITTLLSAVLALCAQPAVAGSEIYYSLGQPASTYGTSQKLSETYDVALHISDASLTGTTVKAIRVTFPFADGLSDGSVWLSKELPAISQQKMKAPDVLQQSITIEQGTIDVALNEPYTITAEGIYVGYSFSMAADMQNMKPVVLTDSYEPDAFFIHTTKRFRTAWSDMSYYGDLAIEVLLAGENIYENAVSATATPVEFNSKVGEDISVTFGVANHGTAGVQSLDYTYHLNDITGTGHVDMDSPLPGIYGRTQQVSVTLPPVSEMGAYKMSITIDKVNGATNPDAGATASLGTVNLYNILPVHHPVAEELTGLWCGWCPRGYVGMEMMAEKYPDDFVAICYHSGDGMELPGELPISGGYPSASIDRAVNTDPGFPTLQQAWLDQRLQLAPADMEVETSFTADSLLAVTAFVTFPFSTENNRYALAFVLTQDGVTNPSWVQKNYYAGLGGSYRDGYMDWFCDQPEGVTGLVYNDVIVNSSGNEAIAGSLPKVFTGEVTEKYTYTFDLTKTRTKSGLNLIHDKTLLKGIALLIDTTNGQIMNANKAWAGKSSTDVSKLSASQDQLIVRTNYYDLQGRRVTVPQHGRLYIKTDLLQNGKVRTQKRVY